MSEVLALELAVRASPQTGHSDHLSAVIAAPQKGYGRGVRGTGTGDGSGSLPIKRLRPGCADHSGHLLRIVLEYSGIAPPHIKINIWKWWNVLNSFYLLYYLVL